MSDLGMPWKRVAQRAASVREIYQRTIELRHTGNNEGTMCDEIEVREADGTVIAGTIFDVEWEYFGQIDADFVDDGRQVRVSGSGEPSEVLALPAVTPTP